jgi:hypothetical protein
MIRATAKQAPANSITPNEQVPSFRAFDIRPPPLPRPGMPIFTVGGILIW